MKQINFRIDDIELRSCGEHLLLGEPHNRFEIVKWEKPGQVEYCYTVAYWKRGKEGFYLMFVGSRPLGIKSNLFMYLVKIGQYWLDIEFKHTLEES